MWMPWNSKKIKRNTLKCENLAITGFFFNFIRIKIYLNIGSSKFLLLYRFFKLNLKQNIF